MGNYTEQNLNRNEKLVTKAKLNPTKVVVILIAAILIIGIFIAISRGIKFGIDTINDSFEKSEITASSKNESDKLEDIMAKIDNAAIGFIVLGFLIAIVFAAVKIICFYKTELALTDKRVVGRVGLVKMRTLDAPLNKIQNISFSCSFLGRIFGYYTVKINTASSEVFLFMGIKNANDFKQAVMNQIELYEQQKQREQAMQFANAMTGVNATEV